jgi:large exoprotein involved in heme utilization and adhesion
MWVRTLGSANLFLINPNGIVFGQNASLNVGGSFVASTATAIQFGEQGFFSANNPTSNTPLLTVNPSALFFNQTAAPIQNNSVAPAGTDPAGFDVFGLRVPDGKSLLLIGSNINMNGGTLSAYGGRIELVINASVLRVSDGAFVSASTFGSGDGGNLVVNASKSVQVIGEAINGDVSSFFADAVSQRSGKPGNITITTPVLQLQDGGQIGVSNNGSTSGGNLTLNADLVEMTGFSRVNTDVPTGLFLRNNRSGEVGSLTINTRILRVRNGAVASASTLGSGNGGNLIVNAKESVQLIGRGPEERFPARLSARTTSTGKAGT